jgi:hypothetical protein
MKLRKVKIHVYSGFVRKTGGSFATSAINLENNQQFQLSGKDY